MLDGEIIWDYPKNFIGASDPSRENPERYPHGTDVSAISDLIREYVDTARSELLSKRFECDRWGLIDILRASDRRVGARRLSTVKKKTRNQAAHKVIESRLKAGAESGSTDK